MRLLAYLGGGGGGFILSNEIHPTKLHISALYRCKTLSI